MDPSQLPSWPSKLRALQQIPQTSLPTLATFHTEVANQYIQQAIQALYVFVIFYLSPRGLLQSTAQPYQSTKMTLEGAASHIQVNAPLFIPVSAMRKCKQIKDSN